MSGELREWDGVLERYHSAEPDDELPPELELVEDESETGFTYRFRDTGMRLEIDGTTYVPEGIGPTTGHVTFAEESDEEGMVKSPEHDVKLHVDMSSSLVATGGQPDE